MTDSAQNTNLLPVYSWTGPDEDWREPGRQIIPRQPVRRFLLAS